MSVALGAGITNGLQICIENASPGRADLKALIERRFGLVPSKFKQFTPGYVRPDFGERGAPDYRLVSAMNLFEFTGSLIHAVLEHNAEPIGGMDTNSDMVTETLAPSPNNLWNWGIENRSGFLKALTVDEVSLCVMPRAKARITAHGISFKKGFYSCQTALREEWFAKARRQEWKVSIAYDLRDYGNVYLIDPKLPNGYEPCRLLEKSAGLEGISHAEIDEVEQAAAVVLASGADKRQEKRILRDMHQAKIESDAKKAAKAADNPNIPKSQRTAEIRANRAEEKSSQRSVEAFVLSDGDPMNSLNDDQVMAAEPAAHSESEMFRRIKEKRDQDRSKNDG